VEGPPGRSGRRAQQPPKPGHAGPGANGLRSESEAAATSSASAPTPSVQTSGSPRYASQMPPIAPRTSPFVSSSVPSTWSRTRARRTIRPIASAPPATPRATPKRVTALRRSGARNTASANSTIATGSRTKPNTRTWSANRSVPAAKLRFLSSISCASAFLGIWRATLGATLRSVEATTVPASATSKAALPPSRTNRRRWPLTAAVRKKRRKGSLRITNSATD
jgi:hypothetical protein